MRFSNVGRKERTEVSMGNKVALPRVQYFGNIVVLSSLCDWTALKIRSSYGIPSEYPANSLPYPLIALSHR